MQNIFMNNSLIKKVNYKINFTLKTYLQQKQLPYKLFFFLIIHDLDFEPWEEFYYRCFFPFLQKLQKILRFSNILLTPVHILLVSLRIEMTLLICRHYIPSSQYSYLAVSYVATFFPKWWCERCVFLLCNYLSLRNWLKKQDNFCLSGHPDF